MNTLAAPEALPAVIGRIRNLRADSKALWGKMSVGQMLCHLNDSFAFAIGRKEIASVSTWHARWIIKPIALYTPMPWPKGSPTRPEVEQGVGGTLPTTFDQDRQSLIQTIDEFVKNRGYTGRSHPMFGPMSERDWLVWGYRHADHHLRQFGV